MLFHELCSCSLSFTCELVLLYLMCLTFLVPAHPGSPRQSPGGRKMVVVVVAVMCLFILVFDRLVKL